MCSTDSTIFSPQATCTFNGHLSYTPLNEKNINSSHLCSLILYMGSPLTESYLQSVPQLSSFPALPPAVFIMHVRMHPTVFTSVSVPHTQLKRKQDLTIGWWTSCVSSQITHSKTNLYSEANCSSSCSLCDLHMCDE